MADFYAGYNLQTLKDGEKVQQLTNASDAMWSELYDLSNPQSSMLRSQMAATAMKCTNWNDFSVLKDVNALIEDSMRAPVIHGPLCK